MTNYLGALGSWLIISMAPLLVGQDAEIGEGDLMELPEAPTEASPSHERSLLWTSVNVGCRRDTTNQHSIVREYMRDRVSD